MPNHAMDLRPRDSYVPLPRRRAHREVILLSGDSDHDSESDRQYSKKKDRGKGTRREVKIIQTHHHPEDRTVYPVVESPLRTHSADSFSPASPGSTRRRDSGVCLVEVTPRRRVLDSHARSTYGPAVTEHRHIQRDRWEIREEMVETRERNIVELRDGVWREKWSSRLERREREVYRHESHHGQRERSTVLPRRPPREVVILQPEANVDAHSHAKADLRRKRNSSGW